MASSQDINDDEIDDLEGFNEECMGEYILDGYTTSSTMVSIIEPKIISSFTAAVRPPRSSSENISTLITPFESSSCLKSTFPPTSWPSDGSPSDIYLQSSGGFDEILYPGEAIDPSSPEPEPKKKNIRKRAQPSKYRSKPKEVTNLNIIPTDELPQKSKTSKCANIPFIHDILDDVLTQEQSKLNYVEKLKVSIDRGKALSDYNLHQQEELSIPVDDFAGEFCINFEDTVDGFYIECSSSFKDNDYNNATQLFSKFTKEFQLVEEKKTEYQYSDTERMEKSMHVFADNNKYVAYRSFKTNEIKEKHRGCISLECQLDFILDGCLLAFLKHLVTVNYSGCFQCYAVTIAGKVCRQVFCMGKKEVVEINKQPVEAIPLKKSTYVYGTRKKIEVSNTYFLPTGRMIYHSWTYSPYIIHMDPFLLLHGDRLNPCMELTWKSDCILYSMFEFEKEYSHCLLQKYLDSYPEVLELLNDFIISLFHEKPESVVKFTCDFFESV